MASKNKKIIVAMSGGIDSSMSLILLKEEGWDPLGVSFSFTGSEKEKKSFQRAKEICQKLKVPHRIINKKKDFKEKVVNFFIKEYANGRTPNPCAFCNPNMKFKILFQLAKENNANYVATGHYARTKKEGNDYRLLKAVDKSKDQSYYLSFLPQKYFKHIIWPMGSYHKDQIYEMAKEKGFSYFKKSEQSQDFCYLAGQPIVDFLTKKLGTKNGNIQDAQGNIIGKHHGLYFYTIGQRKRIGLSGGPYYVERLDTKTNTLFVTKNKKDLMKKEIMLSSFNFTAPASKKKVEVEAKVRYNQKLQKATVNLEKNKLKVTFRRPVQAPTPGQVCAFYQKEVCLGAGIIES